MSDSKPPNLRYINACNDCAFFRMYLGRCTKHDYFICESDASISICDDYMPPPCTCSGDYDPNCPSNHGA